MADCSKTEVFFTELERLCNTYWTGDASGCIECDMYRRIGGCSRPNFLMSPQRAVEIVQKWSDEHPKPKTYADVFLEKLKCGLWQYDICRKELFNNDDSGCVEDDCIQCWNRVYEEG